MDAFSVGVERGTERESVAEFLLEKTTGWKQEEKEVEKLGISQREKLRQVETDPDDVKQLMDNGQGKDDDCCVDRKERRARIWCMYN